MHLLDKKGYKSHSRFAQNPKMNENDVGGAVVDLAQAKGIQTWLSPEFWSGFDEGRDQTNDPGIRG